MRTSFVAHSAVFSTFAGKVSYAFSKLSVELAFEIDGLVHRRDMGIDAIGPLDSNANSRALTPAFVGRE